VIDAKEFFVFALKFPKCFQVVTGAGPKIVLSGKYVEEIRNDPHLSFAKSSSIVGAPSHPVTLMCVGNMAEI